MHGRAASSSRPGAALVRVRNPERSCAPGFPGYGVAAAGKSNRNGRTLGVGRRHLPAPGAADEINLRIFWSGRSSAARALDCGSKGHQFNDHPKSFSGLRSAICRVTVYETEGRGFDAITRSRQFMWAYREAVAELVPSGAHESSRISREITQCILNFF